MATRNSAKKSVDIKSYLHDATINLVTKSVLIVWRALLPTLLVKIAISGNISSSISDHLPQFFILPDLFSNSALTKHNSLFHDWKNFSNRFFFFFFFFFFWGFWKTNWNKFFQLNQGNVTINFENYLNMVNVPL